MKLTAAQKNQLKKISKIYTVKHIKQMEKYMEGGMGFDPAHKKAMKMAFKSVRKTIKKL